MAARTSRKKPAQLRSVATPSFPRRDYTWLLAVLLLGVTLLAYQPAWNGKPIWDDDAHIPRPELRSLDGLRSEERRVGKECRSRWSPYH